MVGIAEELPLQGPRRDVWPFHRKCDAVGGDEDEDDEVEPVWEVVVHTASMLECRMALPSLGGELLAEHARSASRPPDVKRIGVSLACKLTQLLQEALFLGYDFEREVYAYVDTRLCRWNTYSWRLWSPISLGKIVVGEVLDKALEGKSAWL